MNPAGANVNNDLPEGYRLTELGPLPQEWRVVRLGEVAIFETGKREKGGARSSGDVFSVGGEHITDDGRLDFSEPKYISTEFFERMTKGKVSAGDILVCKDGAKTGKSAFVEKVPERGLAINEHVFIVRACDNKQLFPRFLGYWFRTQQAWEQISQAYHGLIGGINREEVAAFVLPLPPLPEQRAIAQVLRTVQQAREAAERVIASLRDLKKSLMRHLFTYGPVALAARDSVPLRDTEIGPIPEHWQVVRLGEVAEVKGGKRLPKGDEFSSSPTCYPYIRVVDFENGSVNQRNLKFLTPAQHKLLSRYIIKKEDVYVSIAGTIGVVGTVPAELDGAHLTENAARIILGERVHQIFLVFALAGEKGQEQIQARATKTSQPKLALARIKDIPIPLPPLAEQQEIARMLQTVDRRIAAEEAKARALSDLFQTLLHDLMTARRRVPASYINQFENKAR